MIVVGVLANDGDGYEEMLTASLMTCYHPVTRHPVAWPYFIYGDDALHFQRHNIELVPDWIDGDVKVRDENGNVIARNFYYRVPESRMTLLSKTIAWFGQMLKHKSSWKYLYRTTLGSYVDTHTLVKVCESLPEEKVYFGMPCGPFPADASSEEDQFNYVSGSGILMSRDVVEHVVSKRDELEYNGRRLTMPWQGDDPQKDIIMDDIEIGRALKDYCDIMPGKLLDMTYEQICDESFKPDLNDYHYHFMSTRDPRCFLALHEKIKNLPKVSLGS